MKLCLEKIKIFFYLSFMLGPLNIVRILIYKLKEKSGYFKLILPVGKWDSYNLGCKNSEQLFSYSKSSVKISYIDQVFIEETSKYLSEEYLYFFRHWFLVRGVNIWIYDPFHNKQLVENKLHWSELPIISAGTDIKIIWEQSRFYWLPQLAAAFTLSQNIKFLQEMKRRFFSWCEHNPPNEGYNWVCAQEVSIRLINFILANEILGNQEHICQEFIEKHLCRIYPTVDYAISQKNNHATSESAALILGGTWLFLFGKEKYKNKGKKYKLIGEKLLIKEIKELILDDGTFSQYSLTYHRLLLDTLSLVVHFSQTWGEINLPKEFFVQYRRAFLWLSNFVVGKSGEVPNIGSNDGTILFKLDSTDYRDFRSSIQLASVLLDKKKFFANKTIDVTLDLLNIKHDNLSVESVKNFYIKKNGFVRLQKSDSIIVFFRYPSFRFRPSQCDLFHVDLWVKGENILTDSGTYSYNSGSYLDNYLCSGKAHNIVIVDGLDPIKKYSKFLYSYWPKCKDLEIGSTYVCSSYKTQSGSNHNRKIIMLSKNKILIKDSVDNVRKNVDLIWNLGVGNWNYFKNGIENEKVRITFSSKIDMILEVKITQVSLYYLEKTDIKQVVVTLLPLNSKAEINTNIEVFDEDLICTPAFYNPKGCEWNKIL